MSASGDTSEENRDNKETNVGTGTTQNPTTDKYEVGRAKNLGNRRGRQRLRSIERVQLHIWHKYLRSTHRK